MASVCPRCIEHSSLAVHIRIDASVHECTYCGPRWTRPRPMPLDELLGHMRERIEMEYEDAANSVGYETAEGGYQLSTMDGYELLDVRYRLSSKIGKPVHGILYRSARKEEGAWVLFSFSRTKTLSATDSVRVSRLLSSSSRIGRRRSRSARTRLRKARHKARCRPPAGRAVSVKGQYYRESVPAVVAKGC